MLAAIPVRTRQNDHSAEAREPLSVRTGPRRAPARELQEAVVRRRRVSGGAAKGGAAGTLVAAPRTSRTAQPARQLVARPRLARALLDERRASTVLLCAPPGYGKTALLRDWTEREARPSAWVTLTGQHHPAMLLEEIVLALHRLQPVERGLLSRCRAEARERPAAASPPLLAALSSTLAAMGAAREPAVLVLDDAHLPKGRGIQQVLAAVVAATPSCAKVALASRSKAILPLGRLRAEGRLLELGQRDLALTRYEAARVVRAAGAELDIEAVARLVARTEGWPAALSLAALALRAREATAGADPVPIRRTTGTHAGVDRAIAEYISQEILDPLPAEARGFLRRGAVLDRLSAEPCDALLGRSDSAVALERLASSELVLVPDEADSTGYRLHGLVREVLLSELKARDSKSAARLSTEAGKWLEAHGEIERAIDHAVRSHDAMRTGDLLWRHAAEFFMHGRNGVVAQWLSEFSEHEIANSPPLTMCTALFSLVVLDLPGAEHWAQVASVSGEGKSLAASRALRGGIALVRAGIARDGIPRMGTLASEARVLLGDTSPWNAFCCLIRGVADHVCGERTKARAELEAGVRVSAAVAPMVEALCHVQLAILDAEEGAWERAADCCETAIGLTRANELDREPYATLVFVVSSWVAGRQGRCDDAKHDLAAAVGLLSGLDGLMPWYEVETRLVLARAAVRLADVTMARASLSRASRALRRLSDAPEFRAWLDSAWAEIDERAASALAGPAALTLAELRILRFLPTHLTFREIGERLHVSTNTVKTQAHAVYGKLDAASRSEAVAQACALGLIQAAVV
jgi:LuxR family transcriptional regulator, maltose regulon positive regulatory protein